MILRKRSASYRSAWPNPLLCSLLRSGELWIFTTGAAHFEFGFFRPVMEAMRLQQLKPFMETEVLPMMLQNPRQMIYFGIDGLSVRERTPHDLRLRYVVPYLTPFLFRVTA